jgi:hypothetical protein
MSLSTRDYIWRAFIFPDDAACAHRLRAHEYMEHPLTGFLARDALARRARFTPP